MLKMGSGASRKHKAQTGENKETKEGNDRASGTRCINVSTSSNDEKETSPTTSSSDSPSVKLINDGNFVTNAVAGVTRNTASTKFYFYPKKTDSTESRRETIYVTSSQFPYTRPKAVLVKPFRVSEYSKQQPACQFPRVSQLQQFKAQNFTQEKFPKQNTSSINYSSKPTSNRSYNVINDRRWSSTNALPSSGFSSNRMLPNRTVAELRKASIDDLYDRYISDSYNSAKDRPPTPIDWYPPRRTNDYLVASSLLAIEQERDRQHRIKHPVVSDVHDF